PYPSYSAIYNLSLHDALPICQVGSSGKSGYFSFVDLVDLIGIEKLLGVAEIDLLADEYIEQVRVDMSVQPEVPEDLQRFGKRLADRKSTRLNSSHLGISYAVF